MTCSRFTHSISILFLTTTICFSAQLPELKNLEGSVEEQSRTTVVSPLTIQEDLFVSSKFNLQNLTTTQILANSLAYGLIEGTIKETTKIFENALYNLLVTKGTDGVTTLFESIGAKAGDLVARKMIDTSVQLLVDAAIGPVAAPAKSLKVINALSILDNLLGRLILNRLQERVEECKGMISEYIAGKAAKGASTLLEPYAQTPLSTVLVVGSTVAAYGSTKYLVDKSLDQTTNQIYRLMKEQVEFFIKNAPYTQDYQAYLLPAFKLLTEGTGYSLNQSTTLAILATNPLFKAKESIEAALKAEAQKKFQFIKSIGHSFGAAVGYVSGKVIGRYAANEIADYYIQGLGQTIESRLLSLKYLQDLKRYQDISDKAYYGLLNKEIEEKKALEKKAEQELHRIQIQKEWREAFEVEQNQLMVQEEQYQQAWRDYAESKDTKGYFQQYFVNPTCVAVTGIKRGVTWTGEKIVNTSVAVYGGASSVVSASGDLCSKFFDWASAKSYEALSPKEVRSFGATVGQAFVHKAFIFGLMKQGFTPEEAESYVSSKKNTKDYYYSVGKYAFKSGQWLTQGAYQLASAAVSLPSQIDGELQEAADKGWVSPFHPED
jgi:hypothetical protein